MNLVCLARQITAPTSCAWVALGEDGGRRSATDLKVGEERDRQGAEIPLVLLVEDDVNIRQALALVLDDAELDCLCAGNGAEALELARSSGRLPDVIILDLMMPIMNGFEFRQAQLRDPELREIPTIVLSAAIQDADRLRELGLSDVLRKPIDLDAVLQAIERHIAPPNR